MSQPGPKPFSATVASRIHREHKKEFKNITALVSRAAESRPKQEFVTACRSCDRKSTDPDVALQKCKACKAVWYCSKECQRAHWPVHKQNCSPVEGAGIHKLIQSFSANAVLSGVLRTCCIRAFNLHMNPLLDGPFFVHVEVGIEHSDVREFLDTFCGGPSQAEGANGKPPRGMLQIKTFTPMHLEGTMERLAESRRKIWKEARGQAPPDDPVGLIEFTKGDGNMTLTVGWQIPAPLLNPALVDAPMQWTSPTTGETTYKPMTINSSLQWLNSQIRLDTKNQFRMRTNMTPFDIQVIRDAANPSTASKPALALRVKIMREPIYHPCVIDEETGVGKRISLLDGAEWAPDSPGYPDSSTSDEQA
ncbi:hypothetical protein GGX14DRAFT_479690 [Mycena pura]|uniref:MYND-type domain-containing protein n=1 Tax=Mycena pura TaxID=153505 RepID=A0AAD6USL5_9AGAR|nr:hypothetical protein GGX14DRAFT_479690 [Mycena pura]